MPNPHVVAETGIYEDSRTGLRYRAEAGKVIDATNAYYLGMPGVAAPLVGAPNPTIVTYAPDGLLHAADLIDTADERDFVDHWYYSSRGSETLSFEDAVTPPAVKAVLPGAQWNEGLFTSDEANTFGLAALPAGRYQIGATVWGSATAPRLTGRLSALSPGADFAETRAVDLLASTPRRYLLNVYRATPGIVDLRFVIAEEDYPDGAAVPAGVTLFLRQVMISSGEALAYRDGDSAGWSWTGEPYRSASSGPHP